VFSVNPLNSPLVREDLETPSDPGETQRALIVPLATKMKRDTQRAGRGPVPRSLGDPEARGDPADRRVPETPVTRTTKKAL